MRLTNDQRRRLIELLEPQFQTEQQRQSVLETAFKDDPQVVVGISSQGVSSAEFTSVLVNRLLDREVPTHSGEAAMVQFLKALQHGGQLNGLAESLQPFIDTLRASEMPAPVEVSIIPNQTVSTPSSKGQRVRKRRRHSPIKRAFKRIRRAIRWQLVIAIVLVAITLPAAGVAVFATDAYARVHDSQSAVERVLNTLSTRTFAELTLSDFDRLQVSRATQQTGILRYFAFVNPDLGAMPGVLAASEGVSKAAQDMLEGLQPVLFFLVKGQEEGTVTAQISSGERIVELLRIGQGRFLNAGQYLASAQEAIDNLNLKNVSAQLLLQIEQITQYRNQLDKVDKILVDAPDRLATIFGLDSPQNYLVLSENSDELRPSGGYISTYGWLRVRRFRITDYGYSPTTDTSPNPPPAAMASELHIPDWWIQFPRPIYSAFDESWYADFPSTAKMAAWFYDNGNNPRSPVDGVLSIDITGFQRILEGLGQVTVPGYNEVVTPQNFREVVYRIRAEGGEAHKAFLAATYKQILADWQTISQERSGQLLNVVLRALQEKHIMVYFKDPKLNEIVNLLNWSGAQTPGNYDYLMVADANLGNKSNSSISRQITYDVAIQPDGSLQGRAAISYDYSAAVAANDPAVKPEHYGNQIDYFNLMQIFVPKGSIVTGADNLQSDLKTVAGDKLTIFVTGTKVLFDSSERFQVSYTTPALIEPFGPYKRYRLLLQKQPGTPGDVTSVQVTLPPGSNVISVSPSPVATYTLDNPIMEFRTQLTTDQWIEIIFK
jgi:hypothetical protein